jgi:hypothetical protein
MSKKGRRFVINADAMPLITSGFSPSSEGVIYYIKLGGLDVHLTYYERGDFHYCHITDNSKEPNRVWELEPVHTSTIIQWIQNYFKRHYERYYYNEKFFVINSQVFSSAEDFVGSDPDLKISNYNIFDLVRLLSQLKEEDKIYRKLNIKDAYQNGIKMGIQFSKTQSYLVFPISENHCFRINANWKKTIFGKLPLGRGLDAYTRYLEKEGLFDKILEPKKREIAEKTRALLSAPAIDAGFIMENNDMV